MKEIVPGIHHWTAFHEGIDMDVSSYWLEPAGVVLDPMVPPEGLELWEEREPPRQVLLTNRHHLRHAQRFAEAFGCTVRCSEPGLHEFEGGGPKVEAFAFGDEVAPGVAALEIGGICPDDTAFHIAIGDGAVAFADGVVRFGEPLGFVPDEHLDDPEGDKAAIRAAVRGLLDRGFDHLLFAHGEPVVGGGKTALRQFAGDA